MVDCHCGLISPSKIVILSSTKLGTLHGARVIKEEELELCMFPGDPGMLFKKNVTLGNQFLHFF